MDAEVLPEEGAAFRLRVRDPPMRLMEVDALAGGYPPDPIGIRSGHQHPERLAWLQDARALFEQYGIGWAMWDYAGGFSVVNAPEGERPGGPGTLRALGLLPGCWPPLPGRRPPPESTHL